MRTTTLVLIVIPFTVVLTVASTALTLRHARQRLVGPSTATPTAHVETPPTNPLIPRAVQGRAPVVVDPPPPAAAPIEPPPPVTGRGEDDRQDDEPAPEPAPADPAVGIDYLGLTEDIRRVSDALERFNRKLVTALASAPAPPEIGPMGAGETERRR